MRRNQTTRSFSRFARYQDGEAAPRLTQVYLRDLGLFRFATIEAYTPLRHLTRLPRLRRSPIVRQRPAQRRTACFDIGTSRPTTTAPSSTREGSPVAIVWPEGHRRATKKATRYANGGQRDQLRLDCTEAALLSSLLVSCGPEEIASARRVSSPTRGSHLDCGRCSFTGGDVLVASRARCTACSDVVTRSTVTKPFIQVSYRLENSTRCRAGEK